MSERLATLEWDYLTPEAKKMVLKIMADGIRDRALALEIVVAHLGDAAFELGEEADS